MPVIRNVVFILLLKLSWGRAQSISDIPECAGSLAFNLTFVTETVDFAEAFCKSAGISLTVPTVAQTTSSATMSTQGVGSVMSAPASQNVTLVSSKTHVQSTPFVGATVAPSTGSASKSQGQIVGLSILLSLFRLLRNGHE
ncbi:MAG: hypothetical protein Q9195_007557 [Heterodermia aff. obscurata]